ncbi:MAG: signal peptidase II [Proteobacteria bacterium]|nr:signal peptidase II [Pseudomonadota bacterium]
MLKFNPIKTSGLWWLPLGIIVFLLDQWTKDIATQSLKMYEAIEVNTYLNWTLLHNKGMAFSLLSEQPGWQRWGISIVATLVVIWLLIWLAQNSLKDKFLNIGLSLVIGGAIGNIYDRVNLGYVVDFIEAHYNEYYWPVFNVADIAISIGAFFLILDLIFSKDNKDNKGKGEQGEDEITSS